MRAPGPLRGLLLGPLYAAYSHRLWRDIQASAVPRHVAIILDGNRRFTRRSRLASLHQGYSIGADRVQDVIRWSQRAGIAVVTLWAISVDNLQRPGDELEPLFTVLEGAIKDLVGQASNEGWALRGIGRTELVPESLAELLSEATAATGDNRAMVVQLAIGYGGQEEVIDALRHWGGSETSPTESARQAIARLRPDELTRYLYGSDLPSPDLILRTSGELRLSGFMLWQSVHSEFYFTDVLWPDFREIDFLRAIRSYQSRRRRFGR